MDLFLVRHGETDANLNKITQGWLDTDLNVTGISQAAAAAEAFNEKIEAIYSSDLKRAKQTADFFRKKFPNVPYREDGRLRERDFGEVTGQPIKDVDWDVFWSVPTCQSPVPGAESIDTFNARVQNFLDSILKTDSSRVLIVTHSGTINRFRDLIHGEGYIQHANGSVLHLTI